LSTDNPSPPIGTPLLAAAQTHQGYQFLECMVIVTDLDVIVFFLFTFQTCQKDPNASIQGRNY